MAEPVTINKDTSRTTIILWSIALPLAFLIIALFFFPSRERFEFSTDEGINLMKGMLVERGYSLYDEIWSDQPPLFTHLLATSFSVFGEKVGVGRFLVLILSCLLLWSAAQILQSEWGIEYAIAGTVLYLLLPYYLILSVATMVGLPAIALAMFSMFALIKWHRGRKSYWLIFSAIALGLSVLTKIFTGFLAPIFIAGLLIDEFARRKDDSTWWKLFVPAGLWLIAFSIFSLALGLLLIGPENVPQLLENHLLGRGVDVFTNAVVFNINWHLKGALPILLLAFLGVIYTLRERRWLFIYPLAWAGAAYVLLLNHSPVWIHHQHLITIPATLLAAVAVVKAVRMLYQNVLSKLTMGRKDLIWIVAIVLLFSLFFSFRPPDSVSLLTPLPSLSGSGLDLGPITEKFLFKMIDHAPETNWVVTDLPMYAFRARLPVPPNLAVFSLKRVETGSLSEAEVEETVRNYMPEQVLIGRFNFPSLQTFLEQHYRVIHSKEGMKLYLRKDL
jgi:4-amino-4-deoxy-L-arabinose transferase-like glycosyltransferase